MITEIKFENPETPGDGPLFRCDEAYVIKTDQGDVAAKDAQVGCVAKRNAQARPLKILSVTTPAP